TGAPEVSALTIPAISNTSVQENATYTSVTPSYTGTAHGAVTWTLPAATGDNALFTINASTGAVQLAPQDFESPADAGTNNIYDVTIRVTDADGNTTTRAWTVTVTNVDEDTPTVVNVSSTTANGSYK